MGIRQRADMLLAIIEALPAGLPLRWHMLGQQFRQQPQEFSRIQQRLHGQLGHWGSVRMRLPTGMFLAQSHLVLSTAWHDFQGLAVLRRQASAQCP